MEELQDLILYENENTGLDFKRDEYRKENHVAFLRDVLSMANAFTTPERFIIIGLKPKSIEDRGIKGISGELTDAATFQQLVHENIEPELSIEYFPYIIENDKFGIIKISKCTNPPYLMKKDYGTGKQRLLKGEGFIRKGSHQTRLSRKDFDKYIQNKIDQKYFNDDIEISFIADNLINKIKLISDDIIRPSQVQKEKIQTILEEKIKERDKFKNIGVKGLDFNFLPNSMAYTNALLTGGSIPYSSRSIETLEENLKNVEKAYFEEDLHELFEKNSVKCGVTIFNMGDKYIEDASIKLKIPKIDGLLVVDQIFKDPNSTYEYNIEGFRYPDVTEDVDYYIIYNDVGNIKHQLNQQLFDIPLRIFASQNIKHESFVIHCELYAKNIKTLIAKDLEIKVITDVPLAGKDIH